MSGLVDMSRFIEAKSDQLNADDLIGSPRTITVTRVTGNDGDQPVSIYYDGDNGKPFKPCKTIRRVLMAVWGQYANEYVGKSMTLYRDDKVTFGGLETGGIRISHMSDIDEDVTVVVMKSKGKKAGVKIKPLIRSTAANFTITDARQAISDAATMDDLGRAWKARTMAPFRAELQAELDARKAELTAYAQATSDDLALALEHVSRAGTRTHLDGLVKDWLPRLDVQGQAKLEVAKQVRLAEINGVDEPAR